MCGWLYTVLPCHNARYKQRKHQKMLTFLSFVVSMHPTMFSNAIYSFIIFPKIFSSTPPPLLTNSKVSEGNLVAWS